MTRDDCPFRKIPKGGVVEIPDIHREFGNEKSGGKVLLAGYYERNLIHDIETLLTGIRKVGIQPRIWCFLTITGVKDARIQTNERFADENRAIDRDVLFLPEIVIDDLNGNANELLLPTFDLVWNAAGFTRSFNFDTNGNWIGR